MTFNKQKVDVEVGHICLRLHFLCSKYYQTRQYLVLTMCYCSNHLKNVNIVIVKHS